MTSNSSITHFSSTKFQPVLKSSFPLWVLKVDRDFKRGTNSVCVCFYTEICIHHSPRNLCMCGASLVLCPVLLPSNGLARVPKRNIQSTLSASDPHNGHACPAAFHISSMSAQTMLNKWALNQVNSSKKETVHIDIVISPSL